MLAGSQHSFEARLEQAGPRLDNVWVCICCVFMDVYTWLYVWPFLVELVCNFDWGGFQNTAKDIAFSHCENVAYDA